MADKKMTSGSDTTEIVAGSSEQSGATPVRYADALCDNKPTRCWLRRSPLWQLLWQFYQFAKFYNCPWADDWPDHWHDSNLRWHKNAMKATYELLNGKDKEKIHERYELFLNLDQIIDWRLTAMQKKCQPAVVYILDRHRRRVYWEGEAKTACILLAGQNQEEALQNIDKRCYEFKEWF